MSVTLPQALEALTRGSQLLLPNSRAARELRSAFDARQRTLGNSAWQPAPALAWQQWTTSLWSELIVNGAETRLLLNTTQEQALWREIITDDPNSSTLGSPDTLAELARSAFHLAARYNATAQLRSSATTQDSRVFATWADTFLKRCTTRSYLSTALLEQALQQHLEANTLTAPPTLELLGFHQLAPAQDSLLTTLRAHGTELQQHELIAEPSTTHYLWTTTANERDELTLAAQWARNHLQTNPSAGIAILVPDLAEVRDELDSTLRQHLAPELQSIAADLSATPWEFTTGAPLSTITLIADALDLIRWSTAALPVPRVSTLLLSPYLGPLAERDTRARFDADTLRRTLLLRNEIDIPALLALASQHQQPLPWLEAVRSLLDRSALNSNRTYATWMELLRTLLSAANWPGDRTLSATEFEATRAWDSVLDLVSTLDFSGRRVSFATALRALERQAQSTTFTPPSTHAPVQIITPAEAEGSVFDAVLFLRATDANWPAAEHTHPLLSWPLQRSLHMPGTIATATAARGREATRSLLARSNTVLFTHATENSDGKLRPSPLLADFAVQYIPATDLITPTSTPDPIVFEEHLDETELPPLASTEIRGGARVLQLQAACGFRAFAEFRLHSTELDTLDLGFDARQSGSRLHHALQSFWADVKTQQRLRDMPQDEREATVNAYVDKAIYHRLQPNSDWDAAYLDLQRQRLSALLLQWLDVELQRSPFRISDSETELPLEVGPLTLKVRYDRIDEVDGGFFLVDYKTGATAHPNQWHGDRPDEPQLPLYAFPFEPDQLKGLAFAKVRPGSEMKWLGYEADKGILPASRSNQLVDMPYLLNDWRSALIQLATDFANGQTNVDPKLFPHTCEHCNQRLLCRVNPANLPTHEEEEAIDG